MYRYPSSSEYLSLNCLPKPVQTCQVSCEPTPKPPASPFKLTNQPLSRLRRNLAPKTGSAQDCVCPTVTAGSVPGSRSKLLFKCQRRTPATASAENFSLSSTR